MARSDPTRSDYCASRHLLRNLREPRHLRRNPLVAHAFSQRDEAAALREVANRVALAFEQMNGLAEKPGGRSVRWVTILLRVDVERHKPAVVAADLGLSTRQFHRERRRAHDRFVAAYRAAGATDTQVRVDDGFNAALLQRAAALADSGEAASAQAILLDLARNAADGTRIEALAQLIETDAWGHRLDRARKYLDDARMLLARLDLEPGQAEHMRDVYQTAELRLRWFENGPAASANGNGNQRLGPRATVLRAASLLRAGDASRAAALVHAARFETGVLDPASAVDLLVLRAELADFTAEDPLLSEELFEQAISAAQSHGLHGRELYAVHQLRLTRWAHTRSPADRSAYRTLVNRIDRSLSPRLRSYLSFSAADVELAIGSPRRALKLAEASAAVSTNPYESVSATALAAGALLRLGKVAEARAQAALSAEEGRRTGFARIVSLSQRINAQALLREGNRRAARNAIEESIECARRFSSAHVLAQAQAVMARITGEFRSTDIPA